MDAFHPLMALLRLDRQRRDRPRILDDWRRLHHDHLRCCASGLRLGVMEHHAPADIKGVKIYGTGAGAKTVKFGK